MQNLFLAPFSLFFAIFLQKKMFGLKLLHIKFKLSTRVIHLSTEKSTLYTKNLLLFIFLLPAFQTLFSFSQRQQTPPYTTAARYSAYFLTVYNAVSKKPPFILQHVFTKVAVIYQYTMRIHAV